MKIKVCGMCNPSNIAELVKLKPDYLGFIFYPKSSRFIGYQIPDEIGAIVPPTIQKVGIFVDEPISNLTGIFRKNNLDMIQLHGCEPVEYCESLKRLNIPLIKAFNISPDFDFETLNPYYDCCDYYLFDTATKLHGGSGTKFNWDILYQYKGDKPYFLSGGIQPDDIDELRLLSHKDLYAVDVNSGFETHAGVKNIPNLKSFIDRIRNHSL
jgi:phosphoribosylanthranilate isomerase